VAVESIVTFYHSETNLTPDFWQQASTKSKH